ncbi:uncharacterized protein [Rutidosis leptorrhynchoides]|uniref:uncharacterized protein n=1 Tax=Rutidosis leptorrhynchoides TaxID=125765 RepID=UPI003A9A3B66
MEDENDTYYVVRKGDVYGVYKSWNDFEYMLGGPDVKVGKYNGLSRATEKYLTEHGHKNAMYTIGVSSVEGDIYSQLFPCDYQKPKYITEKVRSKTYGKEKKDIGSTSLSKAPQRKLPETEHFIEALPVSAHCCSCILEFAGAGNRKPGPAGAGVVIRADDGSLVYRVREGLGVATDINAGYRAVILGMRYALRLGFMHVRVQGDSKIVCLQVKGWWKNNSRNMIDLCKAAKELKEKFLSFDISDVQRLVSSLKNGQAGG